MNSHFPLHNAIAYKPVPFKHHIAFNKCTSLNTSPKNTKKLEFCNPITSNVYLFRPSSVPVSRKHSQQICINNASQQSNQTQICEDKVLEGVGLENKNHQNFQQPKLHIQRDKQTTKNELKNTQNSSNSHSINSDQKKNIFKEMIADVVNQQEKKDETKESNKPKVPSFIKKNSFAKNQNLNQMNLPLNHIQNSKTRNVHTDRHKQACKEHVFHANIAVHHNEEIIRLSSLNKDKNLTLLLKTEVEDKVNRGQPRKIRKQMTQDCILQGSHFHFQHRQIGLPFKYQTQNKQRKNSHNQQKKKGSFQFFRKIKQKKLNSLHEHHPPKQFQLSDFFLIDKLGKGAFGDVFLAQQKVTGLICVIKKLSKKKIKQMKLESQVERQIKIQSFLNHRHITSLYCFFDDQAHIYLILQLLPDGTLMQSKYRRKIPQNQVSRIVRHIALGLSYLHTEKIIHRDLKPQNIFLFETYAKIGDFGCSIFTNTFRNSQIGSLAYVSPEQLKQQLYNQKIDVWSMGIIMYQMLLGVSPFQKDIIKIARKQMTAELLQLKFPQGAVLSNLAREFLMGVLNSDPKERLGIQQALKHEFIVKYMPKELLNEKQSQ